ncbi:hypothetical protein R1flu_027702 [Riccia fluitans]|uniref:Phosphatidylinositol 3,4,5-trisphosphate 3-phosphatase and dual-specificity protein phosphatase PTEN n=1 Tax=Riccia fluitans TaxID=41844 RepID=A0ABD1XJK1_9MARC
MTSLVRHYVSAKKRRFQKNGFDLDLTYITRRIIAMGYPAEGTEGLFRNPLSEVARFLTCYHEKHFKVINLCSERDYNPAKLGGNVERIPLDDHQIAPLSDMLKYCRIADEWLSQDENNVLVTHCKAGKGRSGLMICAYLLYTSLCPSPQKALHFFAEKRTKNGKGVTIPSQKRYVGYFHDLLEKGPREEVELQLAEICFTANIVSSKDVNVVISSLTGREGCAPIRVISTQESGSKVSRSKLARTLVMSFSQLWICGDVKFEFQTTEVSLCLKQYQHRLFYFWLNTSQIEGAEMLFRSKTELDKPSKRIELDIQVSLSFGGRRPQVTMKFWNLEVMNVLLGEHQ